MTVEGPDEVEDGVTDTVEEVTVVLEVAEVAVFETEGFEEAVDDIIPTL